MKHGFFIPRAEQRREKEKALVICTDLLIFSTNQYFFLSQNIYNL
jgi:hypothetical protein